MNVRTLSIARSVAVIGGTAALISGVTFAAFQTNSVTLADNSLSTTGDNLQIWDGSSFGATPATGYAVTLTPGVESDKKPFYLKNTSGANLGLTAHLNHAPAYTNVGDASKVAVKFYDGAGNLLNATDLAALGGNVAVGGPALPAGAQGSSGLPATPGNYQVTFTIDPLTISGTSATVTDIDLEFTGTAL